MTREERSAARLLIAAWDAVQTNGSIRIDPSDTDAVMVWQMFRNHMENLREQVQPHRPPTE
jgi:hypothetical protein